MPIYEYECTRCGATLEVIHGVTAPPPDVHEGCGGRLERLASVPATKVTEGASPVGTSHTSMLRFQENERITADKKKRSR